MGPLQVELGRPTLVKLALGDHFGAARVARWAARGRSAHGARADQQAALRRQEDRAVARFLARPEAPAMLRSFVSLCDRLFRALEEEDAGALEALAPGHWCFIVGEPRTGGTWLLAELSRRVGRPWQTLPGVHDAMPAFADLTGARLVPGRLRRARFGLAELMALQLLSKPGPVHVLKRQKLSWVLGALAPVFGDRATWVLPVREAGPWVGALLAHWTSEGLDLSHSGANPELAYRSTLLQAWGRPVPSSASPAEVLLAFWGLSMARVAAEVRSCGAAVQERLRVVRFGDGERMLRSPLAAFPQGLVVDARPPQPFAPLARPRPDGLALGDVQRVAAEAAAAWQEAGLAWPWAQAPSPPADPRHQGVEPGGLPGHPAQG